jgi:hypothetical protein
MPAIARQWTTGMGNTRTPQIHRRYIAEIQPQLAGIPIRAITEATGLSRAYASGIRRGIVIPHPRHWDALGAIGLRGSTAVAHPISRLTP